MLTSDIINLAKLQLKNILVGRDDTAIISYINLGLIDLYKRFNLSIKSETINVVPQQSVYDLLNPDVNLLLHIYDEEGKELIQSDTVNSYGWQYKIVNYKTFILNKPFNGLLYALYKASPVLIKDANDHIDLPVDMTEALLIYILYVAHMSIHSVASAVGKYSELDGDGYYKKYLQCCADLEMQGYKIPLNSESLSVIVRGYK